LQPVHLDVTGPQQRIELTDAYFADSVIFFMTSSRLKLAAFWRGG
jgi:hypothetical protein